MHRGEGARPTGSDWFARNHPSLAIHSLHMLDGPHTNSGEFVDLQVMETLEGHRESHFFDVVRDVTTNHGLGSETDMVFLLSKGNKHSANRET
jgi:hypothetical protein